MAKTTTSRTRHVTVLRLAATVLVLALWFWTQSLIGARAAPASGLYDGIHQLTEGLNSYFGEHASAANALLVVSSAIIDSLGVFLLGGWLLGGSVRPFLGLIILMSLRQLMQALCALPTPPHMIWRYPGFPSLLVTYNVGNDYFFSGHQFSFSFPSIAHPGLRIAGFLPTLPAAGFENQYWLLFSKHKN